MQQQEAERLHQYLQRHFNQDKIDTLMDQPLTTGPQGLRRQIGELDLEYFCKAYFLHQCRIKIDTRFY